MAVFVTYYVLLLAGAWLLLRRHYRTYPSALRFGLMGNLAILALPPLERSGPMILLASFFHFVFAALWLVRDWKNLTPAQRPILALLSLSPLPLCLLLWFTLFLGLSAFLAR